MSEAPQYGQRFKTDITGSWLLVSEAPIYRGTSPKRKRPTPGTGIEPQA